MQVVKSKAWKYLWKVYTQETTFDEKECNFSRLELMVQWHLEQKMKDSHFKARHRDKDRSATEVLAKGKSKGKAKESRKEKPKARAEIKEPEKDAVHIGKGQCSQEDSCAFKHDPSRKNKGMGRERSPSPSRTPRRNSKGDGKGKGDAEPTPTGTSPSGKQGRPPCHAFKKGNCEKGSACVHRHSLECTRFKNSGWMQARSNMCLQTH